MDWVGRQIGDFRLVRLIGEGAFGRVYEAEQVSLRRRVALKVLKPETVSGPRDVRRFRREAQLTARLSHPNIVQVHQCGEEEEEGTFYFAMQLVSGTSLAECLPQLPDLDLTRLLHPLPPAEGRAHLKVDTAETEALPEGAEPEKRPAGVRGRTDAKELRRRRARLDPDFFRTVARLGAEVAEALAYAHRQGVRHCDIKPSNLLVRREDGSIFVSDFGLARLMEQPLRTVPGEFFGTYRYASPEQLTAGQLPVDERTDVYSLGVTLYELLALESPFVGDTRDALVKKVLSGKPRALRRLVPRLPADLETIVHKAMEWDPDRRYQSAGELADDLRRFLRGEPPKVLPVGGLGRARRALRRHRRVAVPLRVLVVVSLALAGVFGLLLVRGWRKRQAFAVREKILTWQPASGYRQEKQDLLDELKRVGDWFSPGEFEELKEVLDARLNSWGDSRAREVRNNAADWDPTPPYGQEKQLRLAQLEDVKDWLSSAELKGLREILDRRVWEGQPTELTIPGTARPTSMAFSPRGRWLACGDDEGQVTLWKVGESTEEAFSRVQAPLLAELELGRVTCLAFDEGEKYLAAGGVASANPVVWRLGSLDEEQDCPRLKEKGSVCSVALPRRGPPGPEAFLLWTVEEYGEAPWVLWGWDGLPEEPPRNLWPLKAEDNKLLLSSDGLFCGEVTRGEVLVWSAGSPGRGWSAGMKWSDADWAVLSDGGTVGVVGSPSGLVVYRLPEQGAEELLVSFESDHEDEGGITCSPALTPDGRWLAWADGVVLKLYQVPNQSEDAQAKRIPTVIVERGQDWAVQPGDTVVALSPESPDGTWLAAAGGDGVIRVWQLDDLQECLRRAKSALSSLKEAP